MYKHNHKLEIKVTARDVDEVILARIKLLMDSTKNNKKLTNIINQEFKMNFTIDTIRYITRKLKDEQFGKSSQDANKLVNY